MRSEVDMYSVAKMVSVGSGSTVSQTGGFLFGGSHISQHYPFVGFGIRQIELHKHYRDTSASVVC